MLSAVEWCSSGRWSNLWDVGSWLTTALSYDCSLQSHSVRRGAPLRANAWSWHFNWRKLSIRKGCLSSFPETGEKIDLQAKPIVPANDVTPVTCSRNPDNRHVISLAFKPLAEKRLAEATGQHLGKKVVCQLDGKMVRAPAVRGVISKRAMNNSQFTDDEMRWRFDALVLQNHE